MGTADLLAGVAAATIVLFVLGCATTKDTPAPRATTESIRQACENAHETLRLVVDCVASRTSESPEFANIEDRDLLLLYLDYGRVFAERVESGSLTENEAAVLWGESALRLDAIEQKRIDDRNARPPEMNLLGKIGYVLQSTAAGARSAQREAPRQHDGARLESPIVSNSVSHPQTNSRMQTYIVNGTVVHCSHMGTLVQCF